MDKIYWIIIVALVLSLILVRLFGIGDTEEHFRRVKGRRHVRGGHRGWGYHGGRYRYWNNGRWNYYPYWWYPNYCDLANCTFCDCGDPSCSTCCGKCGVIV